MMNLSYHLILASKSPRRQKLLKEAGFEFSIKTKEVAEDFPEKLPANEVAKYLAEKKANAFENEINEGELVITADTVVIVDDQILEKPSDKREARNMLQQLSDRQHLVMSGVCLKSNRNQLSFDDLTRVYFKELSSEEIDFYIDTYQPFDKAGAYGIQEWIGMIGITKIEGSYFNVVGLPVQKVYENLIKFSKQN